MCASVRSCTGIAEEKKMVCVTMFELNSPYMCKHCRQIRDYLRRLSKAQDCLAWYEGVFQNDDQTFTVCASYRLHQKNMKKFTGALRSYPILEVKHCMVRESGSDFQGEGELMCKRRWIAWATDSAVVLLSVS